MVQSPSVDVRRYDIVRPLARHHSGASFLARFRGPFGFAKPVVLHTMRASSTADGAFRARLAREARAAARLSHVNAVATLDLSMDADSVYLVTEWVEGRRLSSLGSTLPLAVSCAVVHDVLRALAHAHSAGVVHGDVDAHRIIVGVDGLARLDGFAIARAERAADRALDVTEHSDLRATTKLLASLIGAVTHPSPTVAVEAALAKGAAEMAKALALSVALPERHTVAAFAR